MKKIIICCLCLVMLLALCACQSEQAKAVDAQIDAIGTVTLDSEAAISEAEAAFAALSEKDQKGVKKAQTLQAARETYQTLVWQEQAAAVDTAIDRIGTVTLQSEAAIKNARAQYDAASSDVQPYVTKYDTLTAAEDELAALQAADVDQQIAAIGTVTSGSDSAIRTARRAYDALSDEAKAHVARIDTLTAAEETYRDLRTEEVAVKIDAIGTVTLDSVLTVRQVRAAYNDLPSDLAPYVRNTDVLEAAEAKLLQLQTEQKPALIAKSKIDQDAFSGITLYYASTIPFEDESQAWIYGIRNFILPYVGVIDGEAYLFTLCHYTDSSWVFFEDVSFLIDGEQAGTWSFDYFDVDRNTFYGGVSEAAYCDMSEADIDLLLRIAASDQTIVRFQGDNDHADFTISAEDKQAIRDTVNLYFALKG